jgi:hypothetical protein
MELVSGSKDEMLIPQLRDGDDRPGVCLHSQGVPLAEAREDQVRSDSKTT